MSRGKLVSSVHLLHSYLYSLSLVSRYPLCSPAISYIFIDVEHTLLCTALNTPCCIKLMGERGSMHQGIYTSPHCSVHCTFSAMVCLNCANFLNLVYLMTVLSLGYLHPRAVFSYTKGNVTLNYFTNTTKIYCNLSEK